MIVHKFTATWCGPCKMIATPLKALCDELEVTCLSIDVDEEANKSKVTAYQVTKLPTIIITDDHESVLERIEGANMTSIENAVRTHHAPSTKKKAANQIDAPPVLDAATVRP